jgi:hypothetical protein
MDLYRAAYFKNPFPKILYMRVITKGMTDVPFYVDKKFKASLTGITHLKEYSYNNRHICSPGYQSLPDGSIIKKPPLKKENHAKIKTRGKPRDLHPVSVDRLLSPDSARDEAPAQDITIDERPPFEGYTLKKAVIRNRILNYANVMRSDRRWKKPVLYFWTVTFQKGTPDDVCYQLFNLWLTTLRQKKMLRSYLWVAERQENGTIHFHILIPHWMGVQRANAFMKESICNMIRRGEITNWSLHAAKRYNGVDIAKDRKTKKVVNFSDHGKQRSLARYLTKYVTKNETKLYRLPWHCSRDWSAMIVGVALTREEVGRFISGKNLDPSKLSGLYADFYRWHGYPPDPLNKYLGSMNYNMLFDFFGCDLNDLFSKN